MRGSLAVLALVVAAACYAPPTERCLVRCSQDEAHSCPSGLTCNDQDYCVGSAGDMCTTDLATVRVGGFQACGLDSKGHLYCWGDDAVGAVGLGSGEAAVIRPTEVGDPNLVWTDISTGADHTCGIHDGEVDCWGQNADGESRGSRGGTVMTPTKVAVSPSTQLPASGFQHVAAGGSHSCAIGEGQLWCWGQLDPIGIDVTYMERIGTLSDWTEVSTGQDQTCGISTSMGLLCWGADDRGQAGQPSLTTQATPIAPANGLPAGVALHVSAGGGFTCAIMGTQATDPSGTLWCWGANGNREISDSGPNPALMATQIGTASDWTAISVGTQRACGIHGGHAFCWGRTDGGALGDGVWSELLGPTEAADVGPADDIRLGVATRSNAWDEVTCLSAGGQIRCFGDNQHGELGLGIPASRSESPVEVTPPTGSTWAHVRAGDTHSCATAADGSLWCWGEDADGEVSGVAGRGTSNQPCIAGEPCDAPLPRAAAVPKADTFITGDRYSCALSGSDISCWGNNDRGCLGASGGNKVSVPAPPGGTWTTLMGGEEASCATASDSKLYCWGLLYNNQNTNVPTEQTDGDLLPTMTDLRFGDNFACGERSDNTRICWGQNNNGMVGDGTQNDVTNPTAEQAAASVITAIDIHNSHSCAITLDMGNEVMCWGQNNDSETGVSNTTNPVVTPTAVIDSSRVAITGCTATAIGSSFACAICGGQPECWGKDSDGTLGRRVPAPNGDHHAVAVDVPQGSYTELAAGDTFACALGGGHLYCWGYGLHGQLGNGGHGANLPTVIGPSR